MLESLIGTIQSQTLFALIIGIAVAINPCIIVANFSALSYLFKDDNNKNYVTKTLIYLLGRTLAFVVLGLAIFFFADSIKFSQLQLNAGKYIGPIFLAIGIVLLFVHHHHVQAENTKSLFELIAIRNQFLLTFVVGFVVAYAFCPEGGALFFGTMIPLLIKCSFYKALALSFVFAIGSLLPIILLVILIQKGSTLLLNFKAKHESLELVLRRFIAALFILAGILFIYEYYFE